MTEDAHGVQIEIGLTAQRFIKHWTEIQDRVRLWGNCLIVRAHIRKAITTSYAPQLHTNHRNI